MIGKRSQELAMEQNEAYAIGTVMETKDLNLLDFSSFELLVFRQCMSPHTPSNSKSPERFVVDILCERNASMQI